MTNENEKIDKEKLDKLKKERDQQKGIPIENEHVSSDPNKSPAGDESNAKVNRNPAHEPYNDKRYDPDPKGNQKVRNKDRG